MILYNPDMKHSFYSNKRYQILLNFVVLFISTGFILTAIELTLRLLDYPPSAWVYSKEYGFKFTPNLNQRMTTPEYDIVFKTNSIGLRDDEIKPKSKFRILLLGDSFGCGYGVSRHEQFADILENKLNIDIINASVGGFNIIHQLYYYRTQGKLLKPDLVLYALYLGNDLTGNSHWKAIQGKSLVKKRKYLPSTSNEIKLLSLLLKTRYILRTRNLASCEWEPYPEYLAMCSKKLDRVSQQNYELAKNLLKQLRDEVISSGADLFIVVFPYRTAVEKDAALRYKSKIAGFDALYDLDKPARQIDTFLSSIGVEFINLETPMKEYYKTSALPLYYKLDGHFTKYGHQFVADILYPILKQKCPPGAS
jgi:lysophospholipase L1-like esterase